MIKPMIKIRFKYFSYFFFKMDLTATVYWINSIFLTE
jgi:hypothetical protein